MRAGRRSTVSAIVLALAVAGAAFLAAPATAAPGWGPQRTVDTWAWSSGSSFARAADGDLVALEATDFSQGAFATDHGPYMGVFARTSSDRGATWSAPVRVSQGGKQADRAALAVSGGSTYAAWVTQLSYDDYDPSAHRVLYFRANTGSGWGTDRRPDQEEGPGGLPVDRGVRQARLRRVGRRQHRPGARRSEHERR